VQQPLSINSLMDIVTIILVYLLKSYSTSPIDVKDPAIELPISSSKETVEDATVVMVTGPLTKMPDPNNPGKAVIVDNVPAIVVDGKKIIELDPSAYRVRAADKDASSGGYVISQVRDELINRKKVQQETAALTERDFTGKVVILADRNTPFRVLTEILVTCGEAGFGEFKFAIVKQSG
jgi:biopolymer transport protein ExbD